VQNYSLIGGVNSTNISGTSGLGYASPPLPPGVPPFMHSPYERPRILL
jgi:hypothetical protein